jgi:nucleotide-binding universal stress UspA family protein
MVELKRILCPVDMSEFSARALHHAVALGRWYEAEVVALAARATPVAAMWQEYPGPMPVETPEDVARFEREARAFVEKTVGAQAASVQCVAGLVVPEILRVAGEWSADLIVMGTHGRGGFERVMLGSVAEQVLRRASCPVLTVPKHLGPGHEAPAVTFRTIVCGLDFTPESAGALKYALSLGLEADGKVVVVHAIADVLDQVSPFAAQFNVPEFQRALEDDARRRVLAMLPPDTRDWVEPEIALVHGKPARELLRKAEAVNADLIVLGVHARGPLGHALFGHTAEHVLRAATCPVLTVPGAPAAKAVPLIAEAPGLPDAVGHGAIIL